MAVVAGLALALGDEPQHELAVLHQALGQHPVVILQLLQLVDAQAHPAGQLVQLRVPAGLRGTEPGRILRVEAVLPGHECDALPFEAGQALGQLLLLVAQFRKSRGAAGHQQALLALHHVRQLVHQVQLTAEQFMQLSGCGIR